MLAPPFYYERIIMSNRYLTKLAAGGNAVFNAINSVTRLAGAGLGAAGRVAGKGAKAFGNQVHLSVGGAYRDAAMKAGVRDPVKMMDINGSQAGLRNMARAIKKTQSPNSAASTILKRGPKDRADFRQTVKGLQQKQLDARIISGATIAGGAALTMKAKDKIAERNNNQGTYYQQY